MAKIPGLPNPSNLSVSGNTDIGAPKVTAADFGSGQARDMQNFGRSLQQAGSAVMDFGVRRERRKAEDVYLASHKQIEEVKTELSRRTGRDAENTLAELDKRTQEIVNEATKGLNSSWAREHFQEQFGKQNFMNRKWAENYAYMQGQAADMNTFNGLRDQRIRNVEATPGALTDAMRESEAAIREMYVGQDAEFIAAKIAVDNAALAEHGVVSLGLSSPEEALKMLDAPDVQAALGKIKAGQLRWTFGKAAEKVENDRQDTDAELDAIKQLDAGASLLDLQPQLIEKYGSDRGGIAYQAAVTRNSLRENETARVAKEAAEQRWNDFYSTGKIPDGVTRKEREDMLKEQASKSEGEPPTDPWAFSEYLMDNYSPQELKQMQRDGKWSEVYPKLLFGGKEVGPVKDINDYINGVKGSMTAEKFARQQFIAITGMRPGSASNAQGFNQYMDYFIEKAESRASELELGNINLLPTEEREKIIAELLARGDYGTLGRNKWRYEVMDDLDDFESWADAEQPYRRSRRQTSIPAEPYTGSGVRDTVVQTENGAEITTNQGVRQRVNGNTVTVQQPIPAERNPASNLSPPPRFMYGDLLKYTNRNQNGQE